MKYATPDIHRQKYAFIIKNVHLLFSNIIYSNQQCSPIT